MYADIPENGENALCGFLASVRGKNVRKNERRGEQVLSLRDNPSVTALA